MLRREEREYPEIAIGGFEFHDSVSVSSEYSKITDVGRKTTHCRPGKANVAHLMHAV